MTEIERRKIFGERLRELRGNLSQDDVGLKAGMTGSGLSLLENGDREPKISTLIRLAAALGVSELTLISAYKGKPVESENQAQDDSKKILMDVVKQIPSKVVFDAMSDDEIFKALLASKGEAKMRELMQEALRRNQNK